MQSLLSFIIIISAACVRFTPSQQDFAQDEDRDEFAGEEAFFSFEKTQQQRLDELLERRREIYSSTESPEYLLGPGDLIELIVFDVPELTRKFRVRPNGMVSLPLIGTVSAEGLTEAQLEKEVAAKLENFLHAPQVDLFISEYSAHKVSVIGQVTNPGSYSLRQDKLSLIELISMAGGKADDAGGMVILIPARESSTRGRLAEDALSSLKTDKKADESFGIEIYFDDLVGSVHKQPLNIPLVAGDTIVVPEAGDIQVDGEVARAGSVALSEKMSLLGAIAAAGGLSYAADVANVEVIRELGAGKKALVSVDLEKLALGKGSDIRLRDGDVVRVPSHTGRFATQQVIRTLNGVLNLGVSPGSP